MDPSKQQLEEANWRRLVELGAEQRRLFEGGDWVALSDSLLQSEQLKLELNEVPPGMEGEVRGLLALQEDISSGLVSEMSTKKTQITRLAHHRRALTEYSRSSSAS